MTEHTVTDCHEHGRTIRNDVTFVSVRKTHDIPQVRRRFAAISYSSVGSTLRENTPDGIRLR